jgi:hypothetical protein
MHVFAPFFCAGACSTTCSHPHTSLNITILWSEDNQSRHSAFSFAFLLQVTPICKCLCFLSWDYWILLDIPLCDSLLLSDMVTMGRIIPYISTILLFLLILYSFFFLLFSFLLYFLFHINTFAIPLLVQRLSTIYCALDTECQCSDYLTVSCFSSFWNCNTSSYCPNYLESTLSLFFFAMLSELCLLYVPV